MVGLLFDEHISPQVAAGLRHPGIPAHSIVEWLGGSYRSRSDALCLEAAAFHQLTLVTYDQRTIMTILRQWAIQGRHHAGVIFIDEKTIRQQNIGGLIRAMNRLLVEQGDLDWTNRIAFLTR